MPTLKEWVVNYPKYWTTEQARAFAVDLTGIINQQIAGAMQALGPTTAACILLGVVAAIVRGNPVYAHDIQGAMANTYDLVSKIKGSFDGPKQ